MSLGLTPTLEAINEILAELNEAPVNSISASSSLIVRQAEDTLERTSRRIQSEGWAFNIEYDVELPLVIDELIVPGNAAWVHVPGTFSTGGGQTFTRYTTRGNKLYDRREHTTHAFDKTLKATVCYLRDFEDLPEVAKSYITIHAARVLIDRIRPNPVTHTQMLHRELIRRGDLQEQEGLQEDYTIFDNELGNEALNRTI